MPRDPKKHAAYMRQWKALHPEYAARQRELDAKRLADPVNKQKNRDRANAWRLANPERHSAKNREWYLRTRQLKGGRRTGPAHHGWKGDAAGYFALHAWVMRQRGKPRICEHCGIDGGRHHWANIDHTYRRVAEDYIRLCVPCHYKYDVEHGLQPKLAPPSLVGAPRDADGRLTRRSHPVY